MNVAVGMKTNYVVTKNEASQFEASSSMWNEDASEDEHTSTPSLKHLLELCSPPNVTSIVTI